MLTKRQILLIVLAIISVLIALGTLIWMKRWEARVQTAIPETIHYQPETPQPLTEQLTNSDALQGDFDALLSGEAVSELYEGETHYGFTGGQN